MTRLRAKAGATDGERFWMKVRESEGGCWIWVGARNSAGYGNFWLIDSRRNIAAHRWSYESMVDDIPPGLDLDHLCRNRACVNPDHLEPVTRRVNSLRGYSPAIETHRSGVCARGHTDLVVTPSTGRNRCRTCSQINWQKNKESINARRRAAATQEAS